MSKSQFYSFYLQLFQVSVPHKGQRMLLCSSIDTYSVFISKAEELGLIKTYKNMLTFTRKGVSIANKVAKLVK